MKRDKLVSQLIAAAVSFVIAMAGLGCLVTAFHFTVGSWMDIALWCGSAAVLSAVFFGFRWGGLILTSLGLVLVNVQLRTTQLLGSVELFLNRITSLYDKGYGCGYIRWSQDSLELFSPDGALILLGCLVIFAVSWTLLRKRPLVFAVMGGLLPLLLCCILLDTVPDATALLVLLSGIAVVLLTRSTCRMDAHRANRITARILIPVLLFSSLVFAWAPAVPYQEPAAKILAWFLDQITPDPGPGPNVTPGTTPDDAPVIVTGASMDLTRVGPRNLSKRHIMQVTTEYQGILYLRAQAYDTYTGTDWKAQLDTAGEGGWPVEDSDDAAQIWIRTVTAEEFLYVPYYIGTQDWTQHLQFGLLLNTDEVSEYTFPLLSVEGAADYAALSEQERQAYCALPEATLTALVPYVEQILTENPGDTTAQQALAIGEYVRNSAVYDLNTKRMPSEHTDFALWFLADGQTGYCIHFATAATALLRAAGIPARYVTGYMAQTDADGTTNIVARQAHAWVEYLDPDRGWTILEATPAQEPEQTEPTQEPTQATRPTRPQQEETKPATRPSQTTPQETAGNISGEPGEPKDRPLLKVLLWILLIWAVLIGQYRLRRKLRRHLLDRGDANRRAVRRWRYIRRFSRLTGIRTTKELYQLTEKAVFSQHAITDGELDLYDCWIRDANRNLLEKKPPLKWVLKLLLAIE